MCLSALVSRQTSWVQKVKVLSHNFLQPIQWTDSIEIICVEFTGRKKIWYRTSKLCIQFGHLFILHVGSSRCSLAQRPTAVAVCLVTQQLVPCHKQLLCNSQQVWKDPSNYFVVAMHQHCWLNCQSPDVSFSISHRKRELQFVCFTVHMSLFYHHQLGRMHFTIHNPGPVSVLLLDRAACHVCGSGSASSNHFVLFKKNAVFRPLATVRLLSLNHQTLSFQTTYSLSR